MSVPDHHTVAHIWPLRLFRNWFDSTFLVSQVEHEKTAIGNVES